MLLLPGHTRVRSLDGIVCTIHGGGRCTFGWAGAGGWTSITTLFFPTINIFFLRRLPWRQEGLLPRHDPTISHPHMTYSHVRGPSLERITRLTPSPPISFFFFATASPVRSGAYVHAAAQRAAKYKKKQARLIPPQQACQAPRLPVQPPPPAPPAPSACPHKNRRQNGAPLRVRAAVFRAIGDVVCPAGPPFATPPPPTRARPRCGAAAVSTPAGAAVQRRASDAGGACPLDGGRGRKDRAGGGAPPIAWRPRLPTPTSTPAHLGGPGARGFHSRIHWSGCGCAGRRRWRWRGGRGGVSYCGVRCYGWARGGWKVAGRGLVSGRWR